MQFESPLGGSDDSAYVDPDPATGTDGSLVRAPAIENHQRELVNLIDAAGLTPDRGDLTQIEQAVRALIAAYGRQKVVGGLNYYVSTAGSDSNNGLSPGTPFLTPQKAVDEAYLLDLWSGGVTINLADGTYTSPIVISGPLVGRGGLTINGNVGAPQNVVLNVTGANAVTVAHGVQAHVQGMEIGSTGGPSGIALFCQYAELSFSALRFRACTNFHMQADTQGHISFASPYTIIGGAAAHYRVADQAIINCAGSNTITLTGTPAFSLAFAVADILSVLQVPNLTFSGSATGVRYGVVNNGVINTGTDVGAGPNANYFPGNSAGFALFGGQYR